jgi:hypothetical protein
LDGNVALVVAEHCLLAEREADEVGTVIAVDGVSNVERAHPEYHVFRVGLGDSGFEWLDAYLGEGLSVVDDGVQVVAGVPDGVPVRTHFKRFNVGVVGVGPEPKGLLLESIDGQVLPAHSLDLLQVLEVELVLVLDDDLLQLHFHVQGLDPAAVLHFDGDDQLLFLAHVGLVVHHQLFVQLMQPLYHQKLLEGCS